jgi:hypothetical protein
MEVTSCPANGLRTAYPVARADVGRFGRLIAEGFDLALKTPHAPTVAIVGEGVVARRTGGR